MTLPTQEQITEWQDIERDLNRMARRLKCGMFEVAEKVEGILAQVDGLEKEIVRLEKLIVERRSDGIQE